LVVERPNLGFCLLQPFRSLRIALAKENSVPWFGLETTKDMLDKADRELTRVLAIPDHAEEHEQRKRLDHAMNCAITIWHVADWLRNESWDKLGSLCGLKPRTSGNRNFNNRAFLEWLKMQPEIEHKPILICKDLCNGVKHCGLDYSADVHETAGSSNSVFIPGAKTVPGGVQIPSGAAPFPLTFFTVPGVHHVVTLKIIMSNNDRIEMIPVLQAAIVGWKSIVRRNNLE
jgi:hypothetical protein